MSAMSTLPAAAPSSAVLHTVHITWKDGVGLEHNARVADELHRYAATISGLLFFRAGPDLALRPESPDMGIAAIFDCTESYLAYAIDPAHQAIIERLITPHALHRSATQIDLMPEGGDDD